MKYNKPLAFFSLFILLALTLCAAIGCSTNEPPAPEPPAPTTATYSVTLLDGNGNQMNGVIVKVLKGDAELNMIAYKGETVTFEADIDTYTLSLDLSQLAETYTYDTALCTLTPDSPSTTIRLLQKSTVSESVFVGDPIAKDYNAQLIGVGAYALDLTPGDYTFLIFKPDAPAVYSVTYECAGAEIGYHGSTFFVQGRDIADGSDDVQHIENGLSIKFYASNIGSDLVFSIRSEAAATAILRIQITGAPPIRLEDRPWTPFTEDAAKVQQHLNVPKVGTWNKVDLTDLTLNAVLNETDGFYHLGTANGPILFIDLTSDTPYINSVQTICANQRMGIYVYDDAENVIEKRSYNELFHQYGMPTDTSAPEGGAIRVPLTEKLAAAIREFGEKSEWWKAGSEKNLFTREIADAVYNQSFAWLLFCGYYA